jgi:hypothetical protein
MIMPGRPAVDHPAGHGSGPADQPESADPFDSRSTDVQIEGLAIAGEPPIGSVNAARPILLSGWRRAAAVCVADTARQSAWQRRVLQAEAVGQDRQSAAAVVWCDVINGLHRADDDAVATVSDLFGSNRNKLMSSFNHIHRRRFDDRYVAFTYRCR